MEEEALREELGPGARRIGRDEESGDLGVDGSHARYHSGGCCLGHASPSWKGQVLRRWLSISYILGRSANL